MKKMTKRMIAVLLSVIMAMPTLLVMPFAAEAVTEWTAVASSDFTQAPAVSNGSLGAVPTYDGKGSAMTWSTACWTGNGEVSKSSDGALYVPDGYIYLSGYEGGAVPIKNSSNWRIELGFRFKDVQENGVHVTDGYHADEEHCFIKMYNNTAALTNPENALHDACYFEQNANGQVYAGNYTVGEGIGNPDNAVCTGSKNLTAGEDYKYVAEFSDGIFKAYIQDENGAYVQFINETDDEDFVGALANTANVNSIKFGDDNNSAFFRSLEYRYVVFSTGVETGTVEDKMKEAIELYETKMGGDIFTGMTDAYDAYVAANKVYDAWKYGDGTVTDSELEAAATTLRKKSVAMKQWAYAGTSSVTPDKWYDGDSASNTVAFSHGVANVLYWQAPSQVASNTYESVQIDVWAPSRTVLLLDGVNTPAMPIMAFAKKTANKSRYVYHLYPCVSTSDATNSSDFKLGVTSTNPDWYGHTNDWDFTRDWTWGIQDGNQDAMVKGESGEDSSKRLQMYKPSSNTHRWAAMTNVLRFVGNQSATTQTYSSLAWHRLTGDQASNNTFFTSSNSITVVNYKKLLDKINDASNLNTINVAEDTYTQGGLRSLLVAYDQATSFNINDYDFSSDSGVSAAGNAIDSVVAAFNNATVTEDVAGYDALRKAIAAKQVTYRGGSEGYTEESWAAFAEAYEAAEAIFTNIQTTGYNDAANAKAKADALNAVEPITKVEKVDTTNLEMAINEAAVAVSNKSMFTTASYTASDIEDVILTAKNTVWQAASNYPNAKFKLDLSDENTAIVANQFDLVKTAIFALKIDKNTTVSSASEMSMVSAIAAAGNYSSEDYGNYSDLATAVNAANSFSTSVNTITEGCVTEKIAEYKTKVRAIVNAINLLRPAFDKITNGTWGSYSGNESVEILSQEDDKNPNWRLKFIRNNNVVVFRTEYEAYTINLGEAAFEWFTLSKFDADLDSINIYDENDNELGEISDAKTSGNIFGSEPGDATLPNPDDYPGMLSASTEENSTYKITNLTVTSSSTDMLGRDNDGNSVNDNSFLFDEVLSRTNGAETTKRTGTVSAKNGTTYINASLSLTVPRESKKTLSATTLPTLTEHTISSNIGMVYIWKTQPVVQKFVGYSHNRTPYTQTTYIMNIAPLMELITKAREYEGLEQNYQRSAWNAFATALSAARADMDYGSMSASEIESACQTRYTNLWNAWDTLKKSPAATNTSIKAVVENEEIGDIFKADNKDGRWSAARWATFKEAYEAAAGVIATNAKYSDANVRDYGTSEQSAIDAYASTLTTAYNELTTYGARADFTALDNAASRIGYEALEDDMYTVTSLNAITSALENAQEFPYLNMTKAQRDAVYSETAELAAIAAEVTKVENLYASTPVAAAVDAAALEAAKTAAKAAIKDPDAYSNINEIKALIDGTIISEEVTIFGSYKVSGVMYDSQEELDAAVIALLDGLTAKTYTVSVVDENGDAIDVDFEDMDGNAIADNNGVITVDYGTRIRAYAPSQDAVDWFYSYSSNTVSQTASKYYTTDKWINVTVKGDTTLTVKSAAAQTETVKVTYVNALTGKTFAVDYATKDAEYNLASAPALAYYTFLGYTLEADSEDYIASITPNADTVVFANYTFDETNNDYFTVQIGNMNGKITTVKPLGEEFEYNDLIELRLGDGKANDDAGIYQDGKRSGHFMVNGEDQNLGGGKNPNRYYASEIYAWVVVKEDDLEDWIEYRGTDAQAESLVNAEQIVMYGDSFSYRVCENVCIIPYTEDEFDEAVEDGLVNGVTAQEKAAVYASDKIIKVNDDNNRTQKISMIGNFTLPAGDYELVEAGMLFKATTNGTIPEADLTLANAGTNGIARMKSSQHTAGNQFVISVKTSKLDSGTIIGVVYKAYMIYTDGTEQFVVYSTPVTDSTVID
jgi:hypothetical protein